MSVITYNHNGKDYPLDEMPKPNDPAVEEKKKDVLGNLELHKIILGLQYCKGQINVARHGVAGFAGLEILMTELQSSYIELCQDTEKELTYFSTKCKKVQDYLMDVVENIFTKKFDKAVSKLQDCSKIAEDLSARAQKLAVAYKDASKLALEILNKVQETRGIEDDKKKKIQEELKTLAASMAETESLIAGIAQSKKRLEKLYEQAKEECAQKDQQAFVLATVSSILTPLAAGVGAFAAAYTNPVGAGLAVTQNLIPPPLPQEKGGAPPSGEFSLQLSDARRALAEAEAKLKIVQERSAQDKEEVNLAQQKVEKEEKEKETLANELKEAEKKSDKNQVADLTGKLGLQKTRVELAQKALDDLRAKIKARPDEEKAAEEAKNTKHALLKGLEASLKQAGEQATKASDNAFTLAAEYRKEKVKYLEMIFAKEDQEFQEKSKQAKFNVQIQCYKNDDQAIDLACASLRLAAGALRAIWVVLLQASSFWDGMKSHCEQLKDVDFLERIKDKKDEKDAVEELKGDKRFKKALFEYYVGWKALEVILKEYSAGTYAIQQKVMEDFQENLSVAASRAKAQQLNDEMVKNLPKELADLKLKIMAVEFGKEELEAAK